METSNQSPDSSPEKNTEPQDGRFRIKVSSDKIHAYLDHVIPPSNGGKAIHINDVAKALNKEKISFGIDQGRIEALLNIINQGALPPAPAVDDKEPPHSHVRLAHLCIVEGTSPQHGNDSSIDWCIDEALLQDNKLTVIPGTLLARITPAGSGEPGKDIYGKELRARPGQSTLPSMGTGVEISADAPEQQLLSTCYGQVQLVDHQLSIASAVRVSEDRMTACLTLLSPSDETPLTREHIDSALAANGICFGIQEDNINQGLSAYQQHQQGLEIVVAIGEAPINGADAQLTWHLSTESDNEQDRFVKPQDLIATLTPLVEHHDGHDVLDQVIPAVQGSDIALQCDANITQHETEHGIEYRAACLGLLMLGEDKTSISISNLLNISADDIEAQLELYPLNHAQVAITAEDIITTLQHNNIDEGLIDKEFISQALATLQPDNSKQQLLVCQGRPAVDGKSARMVLSHKDQVGLELSHGRIDFHEHDYPWNASKGETIGFILPPKPEVHGISLHGKTIKAKPAQKTNFKLSGVVCNEKGKLIAEKDGVILVNGSKLEISELLLIKGDLGPVTGNVHAKTSVHVKGHVLSGFILDTQSNAIIDQNVENAQLKAGGAITIKGGIRGKHNEICTPSSLNTGFIENSSVFVNGDINVGRSIINSVVATNSAIFVGDPKAKQSAVIGGELTAQHLIEVMEIGAPTYSKVLVRLGIPQEKRRQFNLLLSQIESEEKELEDLGKIETHYRNSAKADQSDVLQRITKTREHLQQALIEHNAELAELKESLADAESSRLVVHKKAYPGVIIHINDTSYELSREYGPGCFLLEDGNIVFKPA